jgi:hypothetical protein
MPGLGTRRKPYGSSWPATPHTWPLTPLGLFRSSIFDISAVQFFLATMALFTAMLFVPSFLETVQRKSAFAVGLYVIPLLVGLAAIAGAIIAKTGRYKIYPVLGAVLTGISVGALALASAHSGAPAIVVPLVFAGACGAALFGAILVHGLAAGSAVQAYREAAGPHLAHKNRRRRRESRPSCVRATAGPSGTQLDPVPPPRSSYTSLTCENTGRERRFHGSRAPIADPGHPFSIIR